VALLDDHLDEARFIRAWQTAQDARHIKAEIRKYKMVLDGGDELPMHRCDPHLFNNENMVHHVERKSFRDLLLESTEYEYQGEAARRLSGMIIRWLLGLCDAGNGRWVTFYGDAANDECWLQVIDWEDGRYHINAAYPFKTPPFELFQERNVFYYPLMENEATYEENFTFNFFYDHRHRLTELVEFIADYLTKVVGNSLNAGCHGLNDDPSNDNQSGNSFDNKKRVSWRQLSPFLDDGVTLRMFHRNDNCDAQTRNHG